jgi:hypothetical protein
MHSSLALKHRVWSNIRGPRRACTLNKKHTTASSLLLWLWVLMRWRDIRAREATRLAGVCTAVIRLSMLLPAKRAVLHCTALYRSPQAITGVSTYNVVPEKAAYYFNKIQCFCFEEQRLRGGEEVDMPVFFYLDPEMVDDFNCRCGCLRAC